MKRDKGMIGVLCTLILMILLLVPLQAAQASVKVDFNELKGNDVSSSFKNGLNNRTKTTEKDDSFGSSIIQKIEGLYAPAFKVGVNIFFYFIRIGCYCHGYGINYKEWSMDEVGNWKYDFLIYQHDVDETKCILLV